MVTRLDPEGAESRSLQQFAVFDGARVLEIGCGEGRLVFRCAADTAFTVGIDLSSNYLRTAIERCPPALHQQVAFVQASAMGLPFRDGFFDIALFGWSL